MARGGRRPGAGRKPSPEGRKQTVSFWLTAELARFFGLFGKSKSGECERIVRRAKAFRDWSETEGGGDAG